MPQQPNLAVENNFTKGLVTEYTGLNFPENAATDADNCLFEDRGDILRRLGIDTEDNASGTAQIRTDKAMNTFQWRNAGGDGITQLLVVQLGTELHFYQSTNATLTTPLSATKLVSTVDLAPYQTGATPNPALEECQFSSGNGYLFVYHPRCQPFFCSFSGGVVTANVITVNIRDFSGVLEPGVSTTDRPTVLTNPHLYNLINQGWTQGSPWQATSVGSPPAVVNSGLVSFQVPSGITGTNIGDQVSIATINATSPGGVAVPAGTSVMAGVLSSYVGTTMTINITGDLLAARGSQLGPYRIVPYNKGYINTWQAGLGNYPSNSDVWWYFKNASNDFDPVNTINQVTINSGNTLRGHFILNAFNLDRTLVSSVSGINTVSTNLRPRTGTWFQGRVWYAGTDASFEKTSTTDFYTWTENIYFSQVVTGPEQFGACHQLNDPTSETLSDLLPTDGGVISIQDAGAIYKLFPVNNGLLVFASNGIWFITGSQGIGFTANDYTITRVSKIRSISGTSFVDVQGVPFFWNEEGIYSLSGKDLSVESLTVSTIASFYDEVPLTCKKFAKGSYNEVDYTVQWVYKSTEPESILDRYNYDKILNYNVNTKAFFPYTVDTTVGTINGINYVAGPGGLNTPPPAFKYLSTKPGGIGTYVMSFADERLDTYLDWGTQDYESFFVTGYKVHGKGLTRFQVPYVVFYSRDMGDNSYNVQSIWDFAIDPNSGKYSVPQRVNIFKPRFGMHIKRLRIRGMGRVLQLKVFSSTGKPFDLMGWAVQETINTSS
jgi:hypothetical protein